MHRFGSCLLAISLVTALSGCEPRGETKSLDQVLAIAQDRYAAVKLVEVPAEVSPILGDAITGLTTLLASTDSTAAANAARAQGVILEKLIERAGYTSRASLGELRAQYDQLASDLSAAGASFDDGTKARIKLLVARTYSLLASELETVRFAV